MSSRQKDLLDGVEYASASTYAALKSFKKAFMEQIGVGDFPWIQHNQRKKAIKAVQGSGRFPYSCFKLTNLGINREIGSAQQIRRHSNGSGVSYTEDGTVHKVFAFDMVIRVEAHYYTQDLMDAISFCERVSLINISRTLSSKITYQNGIEYDVNVFSDSVELDIPEVDLDSESDAGIIDIPINYELKTKMMIFKEGPKINSRGQILRGIKFEPLYRQE